MHMMSYSNPEQVKTKMRFYFMSITLKNVKKIYNFNSWHGYKNIGIHTSKKQEQMDEDQE